MVGQLALSVSLAMSPAINAVSDGHIGVPSSPINCTPLPNANVSPESDSSDSSVDELQLAPPVLAVHDLKSALVADESLSKFRDLGEKNLNGYSFKDGLLVHTVLLNNSPVSRIVVPTVVKCNALSHSRIKLNNKSI